MDSRNLRGNQKTLIKLDSKLSTRKSIKISSAGGQVSNSSVGQEKGRKNTYKPKVLNIHDVASNRSKVEYSKNPITIAAERLKEKSQSKNKKRNEDESSYKNIFDKQSRNHFTIASKNVNEKSSRKKEKVDSPVKLDSDRNTKNKLVEPVKLLRLLEVLRTEENESSESKSRAFSPQKRISNVKMKDINLRTSDRRPKKINFDVKGEKSTRSQSHHVSQIGIIKNDTRKATQPKWKIKKQNHNRSSHNHTDPPKLFQLIEDLKLDQQLSTV